MNNVFIAPKIKVGFQKRDDCFTKQLAYIIYYDDKGKLRKETSWESWRNKSIPAQEFDNEPTDGFTLNKDIKRYNGEWWSSTRTMIRIHDPRGFEFEVTTENLIGILMHTDCLRRGLIGQFVYAWSGKELVLLPTNSEEYQKAVKFTTNLSKKVKAKELVPGISYKTKREGDVIFIGRLNWYEYNSKAYPPTGPRKEFKVMVFTKDDGKSFFKKTSAEFLSEANSENPVSNFAELMDKFNNKIYANKIVKYDFRPAEFDTTMVRSRYCEHNFQLANPSYFVERCPNMFQENYVEAIIKRNRLPDNSDYAEGYTIEGYRYISNRYGGDIVTLNKENGELSKVSEARNDGLRGFSFYAPTLCSLVGIQAHKFHSLFVIFQNGKEKKIDSIRDLTSDY